MRRRRRHGFSFQRNLVLVVQDVAELQILKDDFLSFLKNRHIKIIVTVQENIIAGTRPYSSWPRLLIKHNLLSSPDTVPVTTAKDGEWRKKAEKSGAARAKKMGR